MKSWPQKSFACRAVILRIILDKMNEIVDVTWDLLRRSALAGVVGLYLQERPISKQVLAK